MIKIKNFIFKKVSIPNTCSRKDIYLFYYVNEAILNALVHNDWTITEPQISMFHNRLEILSHGGLPSGMTKEQFFDGISKLGNATLMRIFLNMGLTEHTGHGIPTIVEKYGKDVFQIESNYIRCTIPFEKEVIDQIYNKNVGLNVGLNVALNKTEKKVIELLIENSRIELNILRFLFHMLGGYRNMMRRLLL